LDFALSFALSKFYFWAKTLEQAPIFGHLKVVHIPSIVAQPGKCAIFILLPHLNMYDASVERLSIRVDVFMTPIEIKKHFLSNIDTSLAYSISVLSKVDIGRIRVIGEISMSILVTYFLD
jgi:hypothetical protein